jgi:hypothetical protein
MDSKTTLEIVNELTMIHNQIAEGKMFLAGANMISLKNRLVHFLEKQERRESEGR